MTALVKRRTLIISPHADDEIFGCGGTLLRLIDDGCDVCVIVIVAGDVPFQHTGSVIPGDTRVKEFESVMKFCGVKNYGVLIKDGNLESRLDTLPLRDIVNKIEEVQKSFGAEQWFIPGASFHQDHEAVCRASMSAARPTSTLAPRHVLKYELPTYVWNEDHMQFNPTVFVDVGMSIDRKIAAVNLYKSQLRPAGSLISPERLKDWARVRGLYSGVEFAEAFELVKSVW